MSKRSVLTRLARPSFRRTDRRGPTLTLYSTFICFAFIGARANFRIATASQQRSGGQPKPVLRRSFFFGSCFARALAVMPLVQQPVRKRSEQHMNCDPGDRDQEQRCEHSRNIKAKA